MRTHAQGFRPHRSPSQRLRVSAPLAGVVTLLGGMAVLSSNDMPIALVGVLVYLLLLFTSLCALWRVCFRRTASLRPTLHYGEHG